MSEAYTSHFAFAEEKLEELRELSELTEKTDRASEAVYQKNHALFAGKRDCENQAVTDRLAKVTEKDYERLPKRRERQALQKKEFELPEFPTTTIGSFPQTKDVKANRSAYRKGEITKKQYAQSLTNKIMKGMLTGPVTILNWSFPREDISIKASISQIALAIRDEVLDLEANGIRIIQIDEAALREKLPLRRSDWYTEYLDFAIPAFRLTHSGVKPETQIHTHMCYSEFTDIIPAIDDMEEAVIESFQVLIR